MNNELNVPLFDMVMCLSDAMDLVSPVVTGHHKRVAYIASSIARELNLSKEDEKDLIIAGALHDVGAFSLNDRLDSLDWNFTENLASTTEMFSVSPIYKSLGFVSHAELGYFLIKKFRPFTEIAKIIRYHHIPWQGGTGSEVKEDNVPLGSHILHLANAIDILIDRDKEVLGQRESIIKKLAKEKNTKFVPKLIDAFLSLAEKESFWFNIIDSRIDRNLSKRVEGVNIELNHNGLLSLAKLFSLIIDFRSRFTATHSSGVAASAQELARFMNLSELKCQRIKIAGYLHDLGKLAVPPEILNKDTNLTKKEFNIIKKHPFYTYKVLDRVQGLDEIKVWASYHHERIDGTGYPFHAKGDELSLEARIMAVADVFTAVKENRPYRCEMGLSSSLKILDDMVKEGALDADVVAVLKDHSEEIDQVRINAQKTKAQEYEEFWNGIN